MLPSHFTLYPWENTRHFNTIFCLLKGRRKKKKLVQADFGIFCVCVSVCTVYGFMCKFVCACVCVFVWNLICASGPMALVCLHPKSKLCNYDDRPVLFISHLRLPLFPSLFLSLSLLFCLSLFPSFCLFSRSLTCLCLYQKCLSTVFITLHLNLSSSSYFLLCAVWLSLWFWWIFLVTTSTLLWYFSIKQTN